MATVYVSNQTELAAWSGIGMAQITSDFTIANSDAYSSLDIGDTSIQTIFDGNGHTITISGDIASFPGLFLPRNNSTSIIVRNVYVIFDAAFCNGTIIADAPGRSGYSLRVEVCSMSGNNWRLNTQSGGIVGFLVHATIINCYAYGSILMSFDTGGIAGSGFSGTITGCWFAPTTSDGFSGGGGIVGSSSGATVTNCYSFLDPLDQGGGIAGSSFSGSIINCYSLGNMTSTGSGGIAGSNCTGVITNCYSLGTITGTNSGGIIGQDANSPTLSWCYSMNAVSVSGNIGTGSIVGSGTCPSASGSTIGPFNGCPWITSNILEIYLTNSIGLNSHVWSDANKNSPPVLDGPFLLTNFTKNPWNHTTYDSIAGFSFDFTCFFEGTQILTPRGYVPIEQLKVGDVCVTTSGLRKKITRFGSNTLNFKTQSHIPRVIFKGKLGALQDTYITFMHALLMKDTTKYRNKFYSIEKHLYGSFFKIKGHQKLLAAHCNECHLVTNDALGLHPRYFNLVLESSNEYAQYGIYANGIPMETCSEEWFKQSELV